MPRSSLLPHATRIEPTSRDRNLLSSLASRPGTAHLVLRDEDGNEIELPDSLAEFMHAIAQDLAQGNTVLALPLETLLSPNEAAELLGISRPFLLRLIDEGHIPARHLPGSRHRQLRLTDVLDFQARRNRRVEAHRRIIEVVEEGDLPY